MGFSRRRQNLRFQLIKALIGFQGHHQSSPTLMKLWASSRASLSGRAVRKASAWSGEDDNSQRGKT